MDDIIVIGAGPSGLMAAIQASYLGASVTVLERNDKPLKKLYATGNGRCNFSNLYMDENVYRGRDPEFATRVVDDFDRKDLLLFFHDLGMMTKHIGDYIYPYNEQARTVADVLLLECRRLGIRVICNSLVTDISRDTGPDPMDYVFLVSTDTHEYRSTKVIVAAGGKASPAHGSDGNLNEVMNRLGHSIVKQRSALVPLLFSDKNFSKLAGVRVKCAAALFINDARVSSERGEIIFNKDNVSGIPIMQMSRYATEALDTGNKVNVSIDLFPDDSHDELHGMLTGSFKNYRYSNINSDIGTSANGDISRDRNAGEALALLLNEKLAVYCLGIMGIVAGSLACNVSDKKLIKLASLLKDLRINIKGDAGWERAQVSAGGVDTGQLTGQLESTVIQGMYIVGELCDIDGTCGGYNLQWAFSSGAVAGRSAAGKL